MSNQITYVMTTYERRERLLRAIRFYNGSGIRLIICDGSSRSMAHEVALVADSNVEYHHRPKESPKERIFFGLSKVQTEFVKWLTDDDFFFTDGVLHCVEFLQGAPEYAGAWGVVLGYDRTASLNRYFLTEPYCIDFVCDHPSPLERVVSFWKRASYDLQHGVFRTSSYRKCLEISFNTPELGGTSNFNLHERVQLSCLPSSGKLKFLNVPFGLRESRPTTMGGQSQFLLQILQNQSNQDLVLRFLQAIDLVGQAFNLTPSSADVDVRQVVTQAILDWETVWLGKYWGQPTVFTTTWSGSDGEPRFIFSNNQDSRINIYRVSFLDEIRRADFLIRAIEEPDEPHTKELKMEIERVRNTPAGTDRVNALRMLYEKNPFHPDITREIADERLQGLLPREKQMIKDWLDVLRSISGGLNTLSLR